MHFNSLVCILTTIVQFVNYCVTWFSFGFTGTQYALKEIKGLSISTYSPKGLYFLTEFNMSKSISVALVIQNRNGKCSSHSNTFLL